MPLSFLVPAFLLGLAAVAIPIWVHLRNRPHEEAVDFPSLMFLERLPHRSVQRQALRNRALLAVRVAALSIIALAFARPFLAGDGAPALLDAGAREVVVLLDRSWSMSYGDRWARAVDAARSSVDALTSADRVSLVLFDVAPEVVVAGETPAAATAALDALGPGNGTTDLAAGLRAAGEILSRSELPRREVLLISDFQRRGWSASAEASLPAGVVIDAVPIGDETTVNTAVTDVRVRQSAGDPDSVDLVARITRAGGDGPVTLPVTLEIDGAVLQQVDVDLPATGAAQAVFSGVAAGEGLAATVRLPRDRLAGDDAHHVATTVARAIDVLVLENPRADPADSFFLERALAVGLSPAFRVRRETLADLDREILSPARVVVLNDVGELDAAGSAALRGHVEAGGGLVVVFGERTGRLEPGAATASLLPFAPGEVIDRSSELGATLAFIDDDHPALEIFAAGSGSELAAARTYRYRAVTPEPEAGVLLRFDDGRPALVEVELGAGRALVWTSTLDGFWTDLPRRPVYVPLIHEAIRYAAGYREPPLFLAAATPTAVEALVTLAGGVAAEASDVSLDGTPVSGSTAPAPGLHLVEWVGVAGRGSGRIAVNLDRSESDLSPIDAEEVLAAIDREGDGVAGEAPDGSVARSERRQSLWWYLLILAFVALAAETTLSNRLSPRAS